MDLAELSSLVELIVLNVGLQAGIIDQKLFSMFVVEAVVLTFITTPLTLWIYPQRFRTRATAELRRKATGGQDVEKTGPPGVRFAVGAGGREQTSKFLVVLQKIEHLSAVMLLTQMLEPATKSCLLDSGMKKSASKGSSKDGEITDESISSTPSQGLVTLPDVQHDSHVSSPVTIDALKLIELTDRTFSVMQSAEKDQLLLTDDALQLFRQFGRLRGLHVTPHISIVGEDSFPAAVAEHVEGLGSELVILPWTIPVVGSSSALIDPTTTEAEKEGVMASASSLLTPFESIFGAETTGSPMYTHFLRRVFGECPSDIALFVDRGFGSSASFAPGSGQHVFLPFFGGPDDRLALRFVIQLCQHSNVTATIVRVSKRDYEVDGDSASSGKAEMSESMQVHQAALQSNQLTVGPTNTVS